MLLSNLKTLVAAYLGVDPTAFTVGGVDMFLVAANNVRREAELQHSFEASKVVGTLSIDGVTGGAVSAIAWTGVTSPTLVLSGTMSPDLTGIWPNIGTTLVPVFGVTVSGKDYRLIDEHRWSIYNVTDQQYPWIKITGTPTAPLGTYTANGISGFTGNPVFTQGSTTIYGTLKEIIAIQRTNGDGSLEPLDFTSSAIAIERTRNEIEFSDDYWPENRYPSDARILARGASGTLTLRNNTLYVYPLALASTSPLSVTIEAYLFLTDYTATDLAAVSERDFFLTNGAAYMQWGIICELNYLALRFVPRVEGMLAPPAQAKADAWKSFMIWDDYMLTNASNRSR